MVLACEIGRADQTGEVQFLERIGHHQVGQEAGHGLLGAPVRIGAEVLKRGEEAARDGWSNLKMQGVRSGIGIGGKVDGGVGCLFLDDHSRCVDGARERRSAQPGR